jgi:thymidylate synthase (FAD)
MKVELLYNTPIETMLNAMSVSYGKSPEFYKGREEAVVSGCFNHANIHTMPLEYSFIQLKVQTTIDISRELNRHRNLKTLEKSTRYVDPSSDCFEWESLKEQLTDFNVETVSLFLDGCKNLYEFLRDNGIAKQFARKILPLCTKTEIVYGGSLWDWVKVIRSRGDGAAHPDIRKIAEEIYNILHELYPNIITPENIQKSFEYEVKFLQEDKP